MAEGKLKPLETVVEGFEQLPDAVNMLFDGTNVGKLVVARRRLIRPAQAAGQGLGFELPGSRHASTRVGRRPRRTRKRVYLPIVAGFVTNSSMTVPERSRRSRRRKRRLPSSGTRAFRR